MYCTTHYWHEICTYGVQLCYYSLSFIVNTQLIVGVTFGSVIAITVFVIAMSLVLVIYSRKRRLSFNK